jgi:hypothetical protein
VPGSVPTGGTGGHVVSADDLAEASVGASSVDARSRENSTDLPQLLDRVDGAPLLHVPHEAFLHGRCAALVVAATIAIVGAVVALEPSHLTHDVLWTNTNARPMARSLNRVEA